MRTLLKRWWFWVGAMLVAAGIGMAVLITFADQGRVSQANFEKIKLRVTTLAEVREILGRETSFGHDELPYVFWTDESAQIAVLFDADGVALRKVFARRPAL